MGHQQVKTPQEVHHTTGGTPHHRKYTTPQEVHHTTGSTSQSRKYTTGSAPHHRKYTTPAGSVCTVFEGCELSLVPMALVALTEYW